MEYNTAALSFFDNELEVKIVEASSWKEALSKNPLFKDGTSWLSNDIEIAKDEAFDVDIIFTVVKIE